YKALFEDRWAADVLYRGILARLRTPEERRELHAALGLKAMASTRLAKLVADAKSPGELARTLRKERVVWPDDLALARSLLDALEDAGDDAGARAFAAELRA